MIMGNLLHFPRRNDALLTRVRTGLLDLADSSEMMLYVQGELPRINPALGAITLDVSCDAPKKHFHLYVLGTYPGMPFTFHGKCLKSCFLRCAQYLCQLEASQPGTSPVIRGIEPIHVAPLPEFMAAAR